ncbi:MAG: prolipoprotein diacylglyceryl transferase [Gammaproteobacteria bacterium]|nr:prolipoprotein diacylglyceryl transferase [Gammaproteobacteria bacterium]
MFYPAINPVAFSLGPLSVHWYGIMYLVGFLGAWLLLQWRVKKIAYAPYSVFSSENISDIIFYGALGVVLGGRIGYILLYNIDAFFNHPLIILKLWQGGMSFSWRANRGIGVDVFIFS